VLNYSSLYSYDDYIYLTKAVDDTDDIIKIRLFLSCAGIECRTLATGLTYDKTCFDSLIAAIKSYLSPPKNVIVERHRFFNLQQLNTETLASFIVRLKKQSCLCNFNDISIDSVENQLIRDQLIRGTSSSTVKETLLKEPILSLKDTESRAASVLEAEQGVKSPEMFLT